MNNSDYTVIMPFFNEERTLKLALSNLIKENFASEIILVNDGSTDASFEIATTFSNQYNFIKLINSKENKGKGYAVRLGINQATKKYIGILDADLEYFPYDLKNLFNEINLNNLDLVCGSRFIGKDERKNLYLRTFMANKFLSKLFSVVYRKKVTDIATCLKVFNKDKINEITFEANGFSIEVELLAKTLYLTDKYKEYPITYSARSYDDGKKIKLVDGFKYIFAIFKYRKN
jgi:glycosyltransferase involved in cell wall biosynthesis